MTDTAALPAEIWHIICHHLTSEELIALRLTCRLTADIAAELMISNVRVDTSVESFDRLKAVANHEHFRKGVKKITYEAALLADAGCVHSYARHYETEHHEEIHKPVKPSGKALTPRAERLYARNLAKFEENIERRYRNYRQQYEEQQELVKAAATNAPFSKHLDRFLNLEEVCLRTDGICAHMVSKQFRQKFSKDCAIHLSSDSFPTAWQLSCLVKPGLTRLCARKISPKFFDGQEGRTQEWLTSIFSSLESVRLMFRLDRDSEISAAANVPLVHHGMLDDSLLSSTLTTATNLKNLTINFQAASEKSATSLMSILGQNSYPKLETLDVDFFSTTENYFFDALKAQPNLKDVSIAFAVLTDGTWASLVKRLRQGMKLAGFFCNGMLEDRDELFATDFCDRDMWQDGERFTLATAIDTYVTNPEYEHCPPGAIGINGEVDVDDVWNPINRIGVDFEDEDTLEFEYGEIDDGEGYDIDDEDEELDTDWDEDEYMSANEDVPTPMSVD